MLNAIGARRNHWSNSNGRGRKELMFGGGDHLCLKFKLLLTSQTFLPLI